MPVSDPNNITPIVNAMLRLNPKKVLDLGVGFGKYGVLAREVLDIAHSRIRRSDWTTQIDGVEGFGQYNNPCWDIYNTVMTLDFSDPLNYQFFKGYDLVLMVDSLEHIDKPQGSRLLETLLLNNKYVLVSVPTGEWFLEQGAVNGNEYERHKAHWKPRDFEMMGGKEIHRGICTVQLLKGF